MPEQSATRRRFNVKVWLPIALAIAAALGYTVPPAVTNLITTVVPLVDEAEATDTPTTLTVAPYEPIELRSNLVVPDDFEIAQFSWSVDKPAKGREYDGGSVFSVWAPPGTYEVEFKASLVNWDQRKFQNVPTRIFTIHVQGAKPPPVQPPTPPVQPPTVPPVVTPPQPPVTPPVNPTTPAIKPTMVAVIYEADETPRPLHATVAREQLESMGLQVRILDDDPETGLGAMPAELKTVVTEARKLGLPALVVVGGEGYDKLIRVIPLPSTTEKIIEAVK